MTTASTSVLIAHTTTAQFDAWVQEVLTNLITNCLCAQLPAGMDSGQSTTPTYTATAATVEGYAILAFNDTLSEGPLVTGTALSLGSTGAFGSVAANAHIGSGYYTSGGTITVTGVALSYAASGGLGGTAGTGSGAIATVVINTSGQVTSITPTTAGSNYLVGDTLTFTQAALAAGSASGGVIATGSGALCYVQLLTSAAAPVIIKLEFGTGGVAGGPQMWVTMGTGWTISSSNGQVAAVSNGVVTTRVAVLVGAAPNSVTTAYTSRYVYNATYGFLGMVFKNQGYAGATDPSTPLGGLVVYRVSNNAGAAIGNATVLITNSATATGAIGLLAGGHMQCMSYTNNVVYPTLTAQASASWCGPGAIYNSANNTVFNLTTTNENGVVFVFPTYTMDPAIRFSAVLGLVLPNDIALGNTFSAAIIGATVLTFINVGYAFGGTAIAPDNDGTANTGVMVAMLWQ